MAHYYEFWGLERCPFATEGVGIHARERVHEQLHRDSAVALLVRALVEEDEARES